MSSSDLSFEYKPPLFAHVRIVILMLGIVGGLLYSVNTRTAGLRINGIVELSPENAQQLLWGLAIFFSVMAVLILVTTVIKQFKPQIISIEQNLIVAPKASFFSTMLRHHVGEVTSVGVTHMSRQEMYVIKSPAGLTTLAPEAFKSPREYAQFGKAIGQKVKYMSGLE